MDTYYRKTRRPIATLSSSLKRPPPISEPVAKTGSEANNLINIESSPQSPAKTQSPKPIIRPTTPSNSRLKRPIQPPPVKRKLMPDDLRRNKKPTKTTVRELFKSIHPLEKSDDEDSDNLRSNNNNNNNNNNINSNINNNQTNPDDNASTLGLRKLILPATPPATPVKQQVKRQPQQELEQQKQTQPESPSKITSGPLRGVSTSLLDLIRAKEAKAKETTPEQLRQGELLGIAPEIVRIVPTVFTVYKRDVMPYDKVVDKCFKGLKSNYTSATIIECLDLMRKVAPEWVSIVEISRGKFMRLNKDKYSLPQLLVAIQRYKRAKGIVK